MVSNLWFIDYCSWRHSTVKHVSFIVCVLWFHDEMKPVQSFLACILSCLSCYSLRWCSQRISEFKKRLDNSFRHMVWFSGGPVWTQELDSMIQLDCGSLPTQHNLWLYDSLLPYALSPLLFPTKAPNVWKRCC